MFLHASGLPAEKIEKYLDELEKNLVVNEDYEKKYDEYKWIKLTSSQLSEF